MFMLSEAYFMHEHISGVNNEFYVLMSGYAYGFTYELAFRVYLLESTHEAENSNKNLENLEWK